MKIAFIHTTLGYGGAERLILDMANTLVVQKHSVSLYTCAKTSQIKFKDIDKKINIKSVLSFLPIKFFGFFQALVTYLKIFFMTFWILIFEQKYDLYILDQSSLPLILLYLFRRKSLYYCHFPDYLLVRNKKGILRIIYRKFIFLLEYLSMKFIQNLVCNSKFTKSITSSSFNIQQDKIGILYPTARIPVGNFKTKNKTRYFLALNRIEEKKNQIFAVEVFIHFKNQIIDSNTRLVLAGGLDSDIKDDLLYLQKIVDKIKKSGLDDQIDIRVNVSDKEKYSLIANAECILYTPVNEHFGIIPIEGMALGVPTIANNTGGPLESITEKTGALEENIKEKWSEKMEYFYSMNSKQKSILSKNCRERYQKYFSDSSFALKLKSIINKI